VLTCCRQVWEVLLWLRARTTAAQFGQVITLAVTTAIGLVVGSVVLLTLTGRPYITGMLSLR